MNVPWKGTALKCLSEALEKKQPTLPVVTIHLGVVITIIIISYYCCQFYNCSYYYKC